MLNLPGEAIGNMQWVLSLCDAEHMPLLEVDSPHLCVG